MRWAWVLVWEGVARGRCLRRRLRGGSWGLGAEGERDLCPGAVGDERDGDGPDDWPGSRAWGVGGRESVEVGDCGGRGRYSRSESESTSYSESVRSSGSSRKGGGDAGTMCEGMERRSMSLFVVTSTGGRCEKVDGEREEVAQVGKGQ